MTEVAHSPSVCTFAFDVSHDALCHTEGFVCVCVWLNLLTFFLSVFRLSVIFRKTFPSLSVKEPSSLSVVLPSVLQGGAW